MVGPNSKEIATVKLLRIKYKLHIASGFLKDSRHDEVARHKAISDGKDFVQPTVHDESIAREGIYISRE